MPLPSKGSLPLNGTICLVEIVNEDGMDASKANHKILAGLGASIATMLQEGITHYVVSQYTSMRRVLVAELLGVKVVSALWIEQCAQAAQQVPEGDFSISTGLLEDLLEVVGDDQSVKDGSRTSRNTGNGYARDGTTQRSLDSPFFSSSQREVAAYRSRIDTSTASSGQENGRNVCGIKMLPPKISKLSINDLFKDHNPVVLSGIPLPTFSEYIPPVLPPASLLKKRRSERICDLVAPGKDGSVNTIFYSDDLALAAGIDIGRASVHLGRESSCSSSSSASSAVLPGRTSASGAEATATATGTTAADVVPSSAGFHYYREVSFEEALDIGISEVLRVFHENVWPPIPVRGSANWGRRAAASRSEDALSFGDPADFMHFYSFQDTECDGSGANGALDDATIVRLISEGLLPSSLAPKRARLAAVQSKKAVLSTVARSHKKKVEHPLKPKQVVIPAPKQRDAAELDTAKATAAAALLRSTKRRTEELARARRGEVVIAMTGLSEEDGERSDVLDMTVQLVSAYNAKLDGLRRNGKHHAVLGSGSSSSSSSSSHAHRASGVAAKERQRGQDMYGDEAAGRKGGSAGGARGKGNCAGGIGGGLRPAIVTSEPIREEISVESDAAAREDYLPASLLDSSADDAAFCTHVVVGSACKRRTLRILFALARGSWLVTKDWLMKSVSALSDGSGWVDPRQYIHPRYSRLQHRAANSSSSSSSASSSASSSSCGLRGASADCAEGEREVEVEAYTPLTIFEGQVFALLKASDPPFDTLRTLIEILGGSVTETIEDATFALFESEADCTEWVLRKRRAKAARASREVEHLIAMFQQSKTVSNKFLFNCIEAEALRVPKLEKGEIVRVSDVKIPRDPQGARKLVTVLMESVAATRPSSSIDSSLAYSSSDDIGVDGSHDNTTADAASETSSSSHPGAASFRKSASSVIGGAGGRNSRSIGGNSGNGNNNSNSSSNRNSSNIGGRGAGGGSSRGAAERKDVEQRLQDQDEHQEEEGAGGRRMRRKIAQSTTLRARKIASSTTTAVAASATNGTVSISHPAAQGSISSVAVATTARDAVALGRKQKSRAASLKAGRIGQVQAQEQQMDTAGVAAPKQAAETRNISDAAAGRKRKARSDGKTQNATSSTPAISVPSALASTDCSDGTVPVGCGKTSGGAGVLTGERGRLSPQSAEAIDPLHGSEVDHLPRQEMSKVTDAGKERAESKARAQQLDAQKSEMKLKGTRTKGKMKQKNASMGARSSDSSISGSSASKASMKVDCSSTGEVAHRSTISKPDNSSDIIHHYQEALEVINPFVNSVNGYKSGTGAIVRSEEYEDGSSHPTEDDSSGMHHNVSQKSTISNFTGDAASTLLSVSTRDHAPAVFSVENGRGRALPSRGGVTQQEAALTARRGSAGDSFIQSSIGMSLQRSVPNSFREGYSQAKAGSASSSSNSSSASGAAGGGDCIDILLPSMERSDMHIGPDGALALATFGIDTISKVARSGSIATAEQNVMDISTNFSLSAPSQQPLHPTRQQSKALSRASSRAGATEEAGPDEASQEDMEVASGPTLQDEGSGSKCSGASMTPQHDYQYDPVSALAGRSSSSARARATLSARNGYHHLFISPPLVPLSDTSNPDTASSRTLGRITAGRGRDRDRDRDLGGFDGNSKDSRSSLKKDSTYYSGLGHQDDGEGDGEEEEDEVEAEGSGRDGGGEEETGGFGNYDEPQATLTAQEFNSHSAKKYGLRHSSRDSPGRWVRKPAPSRAVRPRASSGGSGATHSAIKGEASNIRALAGDTSGDLHAADNGDEIYDTESRDATPAPEKRKKHMPKISLLKAAKAAKPNSKEMKEVRGTEEKKMEKKKKHATTPSSAHRISDPLLSGSRGRGRPRKELLSAVAANESLLKSGNSYSSSSSSSDSNSSAAVANSLSRSGNEEHGEIDDGWSERANHRNGDKDGEDGDADDQVAENPRVEGVVEYQESKRKEQHVQKGQKRKKADVNMDDDDDDDEDDESASDEERKINIFTDSIELPEKRNRRKSVKAEELTLQVKRSAVKQRRR